MSAFSNFAWGGNCSASNQSPINLSQSIAQPCDVLCDLVIDDGYVNSAKVINTNSGIILSSQTGLGTCKYNGEGYTCQELLVNHPSHHTIENIQADAEVVAVFRSPTGKVLSVSSLVRVNPAQTDSSRFLNSFIPYASSLGSQVDIVLGNNWSMTMMVPPNATFYSYQGTLPIPNCDIAQVIVFSSMINIDQNDFALLAKNGVAGSRPIQPLGERQVFFNSGDQLPGGTTPKDGKVYMRLHPKKDTGKKEKNDAKHADVSGAYSKDKSNGGFIGAIGEWAHDQVVVNGILSLINVFLLILSFACALYYALKYHSQFNVALILNKKAGDFGAWLRSKVVGGTPSYSSSSTPSAPSSAPSKPLLPTRPAEPITRAVERPASAVVPAALGPVDQALGSPTATPLAPGTSSRRIFTPQGSRASTPTRLTSSGPRRLLTSTGVLPHTSNIGVLGPSSRNLGFAPQAPRRITPVRSAPVPLARNTTTPASNRNLAFGPTRTRGR
jgi:carbonic anhydrase